MCNHVHVLNHICYGYILYDQWSSTQKHAICSRLSLILFVNVKAESVRDSIPAMPGSGLTKDLISVLRSYLRISLQLPPFEAGFVFVSMLCVSMVGPFRDPDEVAL